MHLLRRISPLLLLIMLAGVAVAQDAASDALLKADRDFNAATQQRKMDGWMEFMDDSTVLDRGGVPAIGKAAIRAELAPQWEDPSFVLTWEPTKAELFGNGRIGYTRGRWTRTWKDEKGQPARMVGDYLTVWRKQKDGSWKVAWDGGSADPKK